MKKNNFLRVIQNLCMMAKRHKILLIPFLMVSFVAGAQTLSADVNGGLVCTGTLAGANKSNFESCRCLQENAFLWGILSVTEEEKDAKDGAFVRGNWEYHHYVDDDDKPAGWISFDFEYLIKDGVITYRFYNYVHSKEEEDGIFESLGSLPAVWDDRVGKVFTKEQYARIQWAIKANIKVALKSIKSHCLSE